MRAMMIGATMAVAVCSPASALTPDEIDAIGRVVYAEAGNQPIQGKVAVLDTIINRVESGQFAHGVIAVLEQRNAFEPVTRAGGWRKLPPLTDAQRVEFYTVLSLKAGGHLGDLSGGATYFQNPRVVAARVRAGTVSPNLVHFGGGMRTTAIVADHTFYAARHDWASHGQARLGLDVNAMTAARPALKQISGGRHRAATLFVGDDGEEIQEPEPDPRETIFIVGTQQGQSDDHR